MINTSLFPYDSFPIRLEHSDKQKGTVTCFFQCEEHLEKYLDRGKLDKKKCVILKAKDQPVEISPVEQKSKMVRQPNKPKQTDKKKMVSRPALSKNTIKPPDTNQPRKRGRPRKNSK